MDDDVWGEYADDWDDDEGARIYSRAAHEYLIELAERRGVAIDGATVCDFGAGTGLLTELIADRVAHVDAVDTSAGMLRQLRRKIDRLGWRHVTASADIPSADGTFDVVMCSSVLGFVDDLDATVASLAALLRPGGLFVHWDWERDDGDDHGLTRAASTQALRAAGLVDVEVAPAFRFQVEGELVWPIAGVGSAATPKPTPTATQTGGTSS